MKRFFALLVLFALFVGLGACEGLIREDQLSVTPHIEASSKEAPTQEEVPPEITDRTELRGAVLSFIRDWIEQGTILVSSYAGDISADLEDTIRYATQEDPIGAYAVDYIDAEFAGDSNHGSISMSIVFRRSAAEIDAIVTVSGNSSAYSKIRQALAAYDVSLTLRIRNYQEADFESYIQNYCLENPSVMPALPLLSAQVYPQEGTTRILELHFAYPVSKDELRLMQDEVQTIMTSASSYVRSGKNEEDRARLLCRFLTTRFDYTIEETLPSMPSYSLLCQGKAHSLSFASVFYAQCQKADMECYIISGTKNGTPYYWNLLYLNDAYYHVDLMRGIELEETELILLYSEELRQEGYAWDEAAYPAAAELPEPPEETEASTQESTQPTETTDPTQESSESGSSEEESSAQEEATSDSTEAP